MTVKRRKDTDGLPKVIMHKVADIRGGVSVCTSELGGNYLAEGMPLTAPDAKGICHVIKCVVLQADTAAADTTAKVGKFHNLKAGDKLGDLEVSKVDSSAKTYDLVTFKGAVGAHKKGDVLRAEGTAQSINGTGKDFTTDSNLNTDAWVMAVVRGPRLAADGQLPGVIYL